MNYIFTKMGCRKLGNLGQYGVGFVVRNSVNLICNIMVIGINKQIAPLEMKYRGRPINLISAYALTSSATDTARKYSIVNSIML